MWWVNNNDRFQKQKALITSQLFPRISLTPLDVESAVKNKTISELIDAPLMSRNFPPLPDRPVIRDHVLDTLAQVHSADSPVVFIEGKAGAGATTLLRQFAQRFGNNLFALFIKPASRLAYSPDYLRLILAEQFFLSLNGTRLDQDYVHESQYSSLLLQIRRKARSNHIYLLVDGLHQVPKDDSRLSEIFSEVLPIGVEGFRFLISGMQDNLGKFIGPVRSKNFTLTRFSDIESNYLLEDLRLEPTEQRKIVQLCQGVPGRLGSVRRMIQSGTSSHLILESDPSKYLEFIELEFTTIDKMVESDRLLLAIIAFSRHNISISELRELLPQTTVESIKELNASCVFLHLNFEKDQIEFLSEAHRNFAERKLAAYKREALTLQVELLIKDPTSSQALRLLPSYYQSLNQQHAILDLLSKDHYEHLLSDTQSISALRARAALGVRSASQLNLVSSVFQFALHRSIFCAISESDELRSEVSALVGLGQTQRALDLAAQAANKETRLSLLAEFARRTKERGGLVDSQVINYIKELASEIDFSDSGDTVISLAENLLFVDPDLALELIDSALKAENDADKRDEAYAQLSLAATTSASSDRASLDEKSRSRVTNESLQLLLRSLNSIVNDFSLAEITRIAVRIQIDRRIYFLRKLIVANTKRPNILDVVEYGLDQLISDATYTPKAKDLSDFAEPLADKQAELPRVAHLIKRIESQIGLIEKGAPSRDLVRIQMRLAHAEMALDIKKARSRIEQAYYSVAAMENLEIRTLCLASMSESLGQIDVDETLESQYGFRSIILEDLWQDVICLLSNTASHFQVMAPTLRAFAQVDPIRAVEAVTLINTMNGRDRAYSEVARCFVKHPKTEQAKSQYDRVLSKIFDREILDDAVLASIQHAGLSKYASEWQKDLEVSINRITNPHSTCSAIILLIRNAATSNIDVVNCCLSKFEIAIEKVDALPDKIDLHFELAAALADIDPDRASKNYDYAIALRRDNDLNSRQANNILIACLGLLLRAFRGLIRCDELPPEHIDRFARLCDLMPCTLSRAELFGELACRAWCEGRVDLARDIVSKRCRPLLESTVNNNPPLYSVLYEALFPALYCSHRASALAGMNCINPANRNASLHRTAMMVLRKVPPSEPWNGTQGQKIRLSHEELIDIAELLTHVSADNVFYSILAETVQVATHRENRTRLTAQQRADFADRGLVLVSKKLPDMHNIKHQGYVVTSQAQLLRLIDSKIQQWNDLIVNAETITNIADRSLILLEIAKCLPNRMHTEKSRLLTSARALIDDIPAAEDRYSRLEAFITLARTTAPADARKALKDAMMLTFDSSRAGSAARHRRQLVDLAEAMESNVLDELADMIDDDPARAEAKAELRRSVSVLKLKKKIAAVDGKVEVAALTSKALPSAAWRNVSALIAGRIETKTPDTLTVYVETAGSFSLHQAYPVLSWYIENATRRFSSRQDVVQRVLPLTEILLTSTEIAYSIIVQSPSRHSLPVVVVDASNNEKNLMVRSGDRPTAIEFLRVWLRKTATGTITFSDPYFDQRDVELIRLVLAERPLSKLRILTSLKAVTSDAREFQTESFLREWNAIIDQDPPETEIVAIRGYEGNEILVHDRWILSESGGLRLGTSFNALGGNKLTEISSLQAAEASALIVELDHYFRKSRFVNGLRVIYQSVFL